MGIRSFFKRLFGGGDDERKSRHRDKNYRSFKHGDKTHIVMPGDTLSAISLKYYGDATKYMQIYDANRDLLNDPDRIYPGQALKIPKPD